jgi:UDP-2,3-diacylglucosamine hydrolase
MQTLTAPATWDCVEFISDLHLDAMRPRTFQAWVSYLTHSPAQAVFILGDLFEAWVGDDAVTQGGFEAHAVSVLREAAQQRWVGFMAGNRDFLLGDKLLQSCGVHSLPDPIALRIFGYGVLLTHGDQLCLEDVAYLRFRSQVRSAEWQSAFLSRPLAERRQLVQAMRDASREHQADPASWTDIDRHAALDWLDQAGCSVLVHGHTHHPGTQELASGRVRYVLSDWEFDGINSRRAQVLRLQREGFSRLEFDV